MNRPNIKEIEKDLKSHITSMRSSIWRDYADSVEENINILINYIEELENRLFIINSRTSHEYWSHKS